jgi:DNA (cytosine-5)-methyltransferase 1
MSIPVIDLFAGPGGLGEGFSAVTDDNGNRQFDIKLSIEKDFFAHQTLELRSFLRQFPVNQFPEEYYRMIRENDSYKRDQLKKEMFGLYEKEYKAAKEEAWQCELGHEDFPPEIVDARIETALRGNKNWVLIGGPPCQAYSIVGRARNKGISEEDHRVYLYREYLRIIAKHHPKVFVMENVKGLLSAKLNGDKIFEWIKKDLKNPGRLFPGLDSPNYRIYSFVKEPVDFEKDDPVYLKDEDFLIKTEKYGVPQNRHRVILLGIREDAGKINYHPLKTQNMVKLKDVIGDFPKLRSGVGREIIGTNFKGKNSYRKIENTEKNWNNIVAEYYKKIKNEFGENKIQFVPITGLTTGENYKKVVLNEPDNPLINWYSDFCLKGILNHETRTHLKEDLSRYLFSSLYLQTKKDFPKLKDYPKWLLPNHKNVAGGKFADRFRTQRPDQPATTVTSHISKDGHYFIHYDPTQCRSLTVREAARIQTFPDNYYFCGTRTQQYHQVGNAVPPFLAKQLAEIVTLIIKKN